MGRRALLISIWLCFFRRRRHPPSTENCSRVVIALVLQKLPIKKMHCAPLCTSASSVAWRYPTHRRAVESVWHPRSSLTLKRPNYECGASPRHQLLAQDGIPFGTPGPRRCRRSSIGPGVAVWSRSGRGLDAVCVLSVCCLDAVWVRSGCGLDAVCVRGHCAHPPTRSSEYALLSREQLILRSTRGAEDAEDTQPGMLGEAGC